mmetsp:Transcript_8314/g.20341  ORF Transcript_8314/g.20341 Transcript_8314/m.20341 type:complete len:268 (+) Transcript_8314:195-998(+)
MSEARARRGNSAVVAKPGVKRARYDDDNDDDDSGKRGLVRRRGTDMLNCGERAIRLPDWLQEVWSEHAPGFESCMYQNPRWGSLPNFIYQTDDTYVFQLNKSPACVCTHSLARVPFQGYQTHSNNGILVCVVTYAWGGTDDSGGAADKRREEVYASCMSTACRSAFAKWRASHCRAAMLLEVDEAERMQRLHALSSECAQQLSPAAREAVVASCGKNAPEQASDTSRVRAVDICDSHDGKRTWIRLHRGSLERYFASKGGPVGGGDP